MQARSMTMKVNGDMVKRLHKQVDDLWVPELTKVIKETKDPFINVIYDCDPLEQIVWDNVVLVGEAAHPTTPHCARSTNMTLLDASILGQCLRRNRRLFNLESALAEYQALRLPILHAQVLHSRLVGQIKQGLTLSDREPFDPSVATTTRYLQKLQIRNIPFHV